MAHLRPDNKTEVRGRSGKLVGWVAKSPNEYGLWVYTALGYLPSAEHTRLRAIQAILDLKKEG
jgi:hypothetical protein